LPVRKRHTLVYVFFLCLSFFKTKKYIGLKTATDNYKLPVAVL